MIHLSRFLIGIRHNRAFRIRSLSGELIDDLIKLFAQDFTLVTEVSSNEEFVLRNPTDNLLLRGNKDNIIVENRKLFDFESHKYIEVNKAKTIDIAEKSLPVVVDTLSFKKDFNKIGMIFEFRIPKWESMKPCSFADFIYTNFVNFEKESASETGESNVKFSYKLRAPGGAAVKGLKDYRNVIIIINESTGLDEEGKEQKCLFISVDIQHIFDPTREVVSVKEHYEFAKQHLLATILPKFKTRDIDITYE